MSLDYPYNQQRVDDRTITELIGISRGLLADGVLNEQEIVFLIDWLEANKFITAWPVNVLRERIAVMLLDGIIDKNERKEIFEILQMLVGGNAASQNIHSFSSSLPLTRPTPEIVIEGKTFCLTGKFACGLRKNCHDTILSLGGLVKESITQNLDYLVVGFVGTKDWAHSSFGRKIQKAVDYINSGYNIAIVGEDTWFESLGCPIINE